MLTEKIILRVSEEMRDYLEKRATETGIGSMSSYVRYILTRDMRSDEDAILRIRKNAKKQEANRSEPAAVH